MSERLRRWTRNPLGSARRGSNPLGVVLIKSPRLSLLHPDPPTPLTLIGSCRVLRIFLHNSYIFPIQQIPRCQ